MSIHTLESRLNDIEKILYDYLDDSIQGPKVIFISFSDTKTRAEVVKCASQSWKESWEKVFHLMIQRVKTNGNSANWIKIDWITNLELLTFKDFKKHISTGKANYFRKGIALDEKFKFAFLEQEINGNGFIQKSNDNEEMDISWKNINRYLKQNDKMNVLLDESMIKYVILFQTQSIFFDEINHFLLENNSEATGRRKIDSHNPDEIGMIIKNASGYLANQIDERGAYRYGWFPCFNKEIDHYNILRHASTTYSMIEAYELFEDPVLKAAIQKALSFLVEDAIIYKIMSNGESAAFVVEKSADNEIKLGANAAALLALENYMQVFKDRSFVEVAQALAIGIQYMQQADGSFVHVLDNQTLNVKEISRIIYYDGEAAFALIRWYRFTENERWLESVRRAFNYFTDEKYWRHHDHWLSYASYEYYHFCKEDIILEFNLKNSEGILEFALHRETTYPTLLELLMATSNLLHYANTIRKGDTLRNSYNQKFHDQVVIKRVEHQLNGVMFPEVAMYFQVPNQILWSFFIRHHSFRIRIDDVEHNLSGYCQYYKWQFQMK